MLVLLIIADPKDKGKRERAKGMEWTGITKQILK